MHESIPDTISRTITTSPEKLRRSSTWDQGAEMAQHAALKIKRRRALYFCDPHSPCQRCTSEDINGLQRQCFLRGTDLGVHSAWQPPSTLGPQTLAWKTPVEALDQLSINKPRVATTPLNPANEPSRFIAKSSPLPAWSAQWADVVTHMITSRRPRCRGLGGRGVLPAAAAVQNMNNPKSANPSDFWRRIGF
jgi:hypothetical protein